jgi:hypothetical protein
MNRSFSTRFAGCLAAIVTIGLVGGFPAAAVAGGGPENVLLVVNRRSAASMTIANHYVRLRGVPAGNVLTLPWDPAVQTAKIDAFREQILAPVLTAIQKRRLTAQIDYVVYSSDFPTAIHLDQDVTRFLARTEEEASENSSTPTANRQWPKHFTKVGSINGLTYLWRPVMGRNPSYFELTSNRYMRRQTIASKEVASLGFRNTHQFGPYGELLESGGRRYLLSVMLGVTSGRGNSLEEVLGYLRRSATADDTHPRGTIYFVENKDVRSKVRHGQFPTTVRELEKLGVAAEIMQGTVPVGKDDVQGAMLGTASFSWKSSGSTILPGAICEHFTSYGGIMRSGAAQTPLSEFLRYGAAGASGTVFEPYSIPHKFPAPMMHVHYARGCTLAEAFYQSVLGPYQLLIVGDPLCRPWANIPQVEVEGVEPGTTVTGKLSIRPSAKVPGGSTVDHFELLIDGWLRTTCRPGESLDFDTALLADGYHELRVVGVEAGPIQSQGRRIFSITTANHQRKITASVTPSGNVGPGKPLLLSADSPGSTTIAVLHNSRLLGTIAGGQGQLEVDPATLGYGPVQLRVVGVGKGGSTSYAWAKPLELVVDGGP